MPFPLFLMTIVVIKMTGHSLYPRVDIFEKIKLTLMPFKLHKQSLGQHTDRTCYMLYLALPKSLPFVHFIDDHCPYRHLKYLAAMSLEGPSSSKNGWMMRCSFSTELSVKLALPSGL